jgi:hypothetical protein
VLAWNQGFRIVEKVWCRHMWQSSIINWVESIEIYIVVYVYKFKFELWKGGAGDKIELEEITKNQKWNSHLELLSRGV